MATTLRLKLTCCGQTLTTRQDVLRHFGTQPALAIWKKDQFFYCNDHNGVYHSNCQNCVNAAFVNKIDRSLQRKGLMLNQYCED